MTRDNVEFKSDAHYALDRLYAGGDDDPTLSAEEMPVIPAPAVKPVKRRVHVIPSPSAPAKPRRWPFTRQPAYDLGFPLVSKADPFWPPPHASLQWAIVWVLGPIDLFLLGNIVWILLTVRWS